MSRIKIRRDHDLAIDQVREAAQHVVESLSRQYGLDYQWRADELHFSRTGLTGCLTIDSTVLAVDAKLGMMLAPLKSPIKQEISRKLDEFLNP